MSGPGVADGGTTDAELERLAASVLLPGFVGRTVPAWLARALDGGLAGVVLFAQNLDPDDPAQPARLAAELRSHADAPVVAVDEEGGVVTRLESVHGSTLPSPAQLGLVDDVALTEAVARELGERVRAAGGTLVLAPDADVASDPRNPVIGPRAFGSDPALVARHVAASVRGIQAAGVGACAKHWPGHGATTVDSHLALPSVPRAVLDAGHDVPFRAAVDAGVAAVMTAHVVVPEAGPAPATVNPALIGELRALGFDGPVVTDAIDMAAIRVTYGTPAGAVAALRAGVDLVCLGNPGFVPAGGSAGSAGSYDDEALYLAVHSAVVDAVREGNLDRDRLEQASLRVATLRVSGNGGPTAAGAAKPVAAGPEPGRSSDEAVRGLDLDRAAARVADAVLVRTLPARPVPFGTVRDARAAATAAVASRAHPVVPALDRHATPGAPGVAVVVDRLTDRKQRAAVQWLREQGRLALVVDVGAPGAHVPGSVVRAGVPRVPLGADSRFSVRVLDRVLAGLAAAAPDDGAAAARAARAPARGALR
ncbi:glycoside hydrolase family 3 N-terminal domain-containing protein [Luteimicrobium xylanilyticum]|uniref:Beta-N-acetylhexosaminidase n=1 Tax=Luteimicrobium xylanilyticum TaxID=1133546 RepID=A0A5P9QGA3_9MICO|nr:glycoside hydrolase family 3 N-terminal domain-containing protein [Luteimicrobium xylanilyticum]QFU99485.1 Beta-N-acetylhexosaminidase [Luteimicrobium xylanilyticum]